MTPGDRRWDRRYNCNLNLSYYLPEADCSGTGRTIDMSKGGVYFDSSSDLETGTPIELHIEWPFLLRDTYPLTLVVSGKVVRANSGRAAVRTAAYEFRPRELDWMPLVAEDLREYARMQ
jgi:hypothetical protein